MDSMMKTGFLLVFTGLMILIGGCTKRTTLVPLDPAQYPYPKQTRIEYQLGDTRLATVSYESGKPGLVFFNMHDNENTSVEAGVHFIRKYGGQLIELKHTGQRLVDFSLSGKTYTFDPNRMFTDAGAQATLERYSQADSEAVDQLRKFADQVLRDHSLDRGDLIITLHNNTQDRYSARSYLPGNEYENDAEEVFIAPGKDPDDFYFVTVRSFFDLIRNRGFNAVLQNNQTATDDGSLSVLAAKLSIPYVNIEAQHNHMAEQFEMLEVLRDVIESQ